MKNPSEEIVTAWLQECKGFFTMNNIKVPRYKGGMGAEIDILGKSGNKNIWVEVSVSTNPRQGHKKKVRFENTVNYYMGDFIRPDKQNKVAGYFGKKYEKWLVYGKIALPKKELEKFPEELEKRGIKPVYFGEIFKDMRQLKQYRLDSARGYMNLFETFGNGV